MTSPRPAGAAVEAPPTLAFRVEGAESVRYAAAPTIAFALRVESDVAVRSLSLTAQIRIAAAARRYDGETKERLFELFGAPDGWGRTLRSLLWTHAAVHVGAFEGTTAVELPVPCTYDLELSSAKYLYAVEDGPVPLEFLFSGTVFYDGEGGLLRAAQVSWDSEAGFALPAGLWREAIDLHFPGAAWLRIRRDVYDRLFDYKAGRALPTWEAALESLLEGR